MATLEQRGHFARWEIREQYYGKWEEERIICHTHSIENAVTVIKAFLKANAGRPFAYKATKIANDDKMMYDMLDTWEINPVTGDFEEKSYASYLDWTHTYKKEEK